MARNACLRGEKAARSDAGGGTVATGGKHGNSMVFLNEAWPGPPGFAAHFDRIWGGRFPRPAHSRISARGPGQPPKLKSCTGCFVEGLLTMLRGRG